MAKNKKATAARRTVAASPDLTKSQSALLDQALTEDSKVRDVFHQHFAEQAQGSLHFASVAQEAFKAWAPTSFSKAERVALNYLRPGESLGQSLHAVVEKAINRMRDDGKTNVLRIQKAEHIEELIDKTNARSPAVGKVAVGDLLDLLMAKFAWPTLRNEPALTLCEAAKEAEKRMNQIEGKPAAGAAAPAVNQPPPPAATDNPGNKEFIKQQIQTLLGTVTSPEERVTVGLPQRAELNKLELANAANSTQTFELRAGASDVTSYHDISSLQVAFEHVWTEIFDGRLKGLGADLYKAYIEHLDFLGLKPDPKRTITSVNDIQALMADIRQMTAVAPPAAGQFSFGPGGFSFGKGGFTSSLLGASVGLTTTTNATGTTTDAPPAIPGAARLSALFAEILSILSRPYSFHVFANKAINFGIMVTYRQTWKPENYQVGDLVSTIPLAPREVRRYTTKSVSKKTRAQKELEDNLRTTKTEVDSTSRVEREIIDKAEQKTNFNATAHESFGGQGYQIDATQQGGGDQSQMSADTKRSFHEAVLKSAQEYRQQNRMEIDTSSSVETEDTTFHEIQNPNDELTVTYLFYELQRTYRISERIHHVTPVILVANEVPAPDSIDDAWLIRYDWILRRVILDDSFRPALDYLTKSFVGAELNIQLLDNNAKAQKKIVDDIKAQIAVQTALVERSQDELANQVKTEAGIQIGGSILNTVKRIFDPLQITGDAAGKTVEGVRTLVDFAQQAVDRAEREKARLLDQLGVGSTALQSAIDKLSAAMKEHYDRMLEVDRLEIHVKENILYYMQAIWNHEPPDQRFFRIYTTQVPIIEPANQNRQVTVSNSGNELTDALAGNSTLVAELSMADVTVNSKQLVEIADLDTVLGYKGNYAIYRLKENNYLTLHMMQNYLVLSGELEIRDPDDFANRTVEELQQLATCLYQRDRPAYKRHSEEIKKLIMDRLTSGRAEDDRVIVPTHSLYIEALVGTHPLLEDFKLLHRALDVKKVQGEVRHAELENVRLGARALEGQLDDPDVEKKIIVEGAANVAVLPDA
jgi:hypothetical protein